MAGDITGAARVTASQPVMPEGDGAPGGTTGHTRTSTIAAG
jgi:hypothetical protein